MTGDSRIVIDRTLCELLGNLFELDLSYQSFLAVPPRLFTMPGLAETLVVLHLSDNNLQVLDPLLAMFKKLTVLNLRYNEIRSIPREIAALK